MTNRLRGGTSEGRRPWPWGRKPPGHVPLWLVRLVKGKDLRRYVGANLRVSNVRAKAIGLKLQYPEFPEGIRTALAR